MRVVNRPQQAPSTLGSLSSAVGPASFQGKNYLNLNNGLVIPPAQQNVVSFTFTTKSTGLVLVMCAMTVDASNAGDIVFFLPIHNGSLMNLGVTAVASGGVPLAAGTVIALASVGVGVEHEFGVQAVNNTPGHTVSSGPGHCQVILIEL